MAVHARKAKVSQVVHVEEREEKEEEADFQGSQEIIQQVMSRAQDLETRLQLPLLLAPDENGKESEITQISTLKGRAKQLDARDLKDVAPFRRSWLCGPEHQLDYAVLCTPQGVAAMQLRGWTTKPSKSSRRRAKILKQQQQQTEMKKMKNLDEGPAAGLAEMMDGSAPGPVVVDFVGGLAGDKSKYGGFSRASPMIRAIHAAPKDVMAEYVPCVAAPAVGIEGVSPRVHIVDATAGFGTDAWIFASLGYSVTMIERQPVLHALLEDALQRAAANEETAAIVERISLICGDSSQVLDQMAEEEARPHVVYMDPFFPELAGLNRSARNRVPRKELQLARLLDAGVSDVDDPDAAALRDREHLDNVSRLLAVARNTARCKVVVKWPTTAPFLDEGVDHIRTERGKHRFDVFCPNHRLGDVH